MQAEDERNELEAVVQSPTRVLVVDDEESALMVIPEALRDGLEDLGWTQLTIETAASGEEALEVAGDAPLHLLVTDVVMPGIDGIETYARLKKHNPHLACVVMTAQAPEHSTPIRALRLGAADYVRKPLNPDYLVETCHRQLVVHHLRRAALESRALLGAIIDSIDAGVVAVREGEVATSNQAAERLLGVGVDELVEHVEALGPGETLVTGDDGEARLVSTTVNPVVDRAGGELGQVFVMRDVTNLVNAEQMESFKRMAAIAAHEMKNSVTGLGLVTEHLVARLKEGRLEPRETQRMAEIIMDSVGRMGRFARSFLNFSRIPDPKTVPTVPNSLINDALELYASEKGLPDWVTLDKKLREGLPLVDADPDLMFQVLQNLIINAVEAMEGGRGKRVLVESALHQSADACFVRLTVADEGPGVPVGMREKIFEPNVTTREAGSGLGLVIVRDIVHKHGGRIRLQCPETGGARFDILLPALETAE
ncbi:MAG: nitrogen fixation/metabolism regulation signal transduction histidine kinase [Myxococcota bacterium]|jgi:nitrogen fixation/metabolism regulation signal transduction histidine kinase